MKKVWRIMAVGAFLALFLYINLSAQDPYYWTIKVRNLLQVQSGASLDVDGTADFSNGMTVSSGNLTVNGTADFSNGMTVSSGNLTVSGVTTFNGRTILATAVCDTNAFTGTATVDTVVVTGATVNSIFLVSGMYTAGVDQQDVLQWEARTDSLFVYRLAAGESGLKYSYLWVR